MSIQTKPAPLFLEFPYGQVVFENISHFGLPRSPSNLWAVKSAWKEWNRAYRKACSLGIDVTEYNCPYPNAGYRQIDHYTIDLLYRIKKKE